MKKFKCEVTRVDEYIIEIDENICDEEWLDHYAKYFYDFDDLKEHAENIAQFRARFGDRFIDGYGFTKVNREQSLGDVISNGRRNVSDVPINIKIVSEDDDCEIDVEKIE